MPFRDGDRITVLGKGLLIGLLAWPFVFVTLFFEGRIVLASCLLIGWFGLAFQLLPALSSEWNRRLPMFGALAAALAIPVLVNPAVWSSSKSTPSSDFGIFLFDTKLYLHHDMIDLVEACHGM